MDNDNPQGGAGEPAMDSGGWRAQLMPDARHRIVNKIGETLKRHLPYTGEEGILELKKIAVRFEEKMYSSATSQSDYLRKISLKMLTMETKSQNLKPDDPNGNSPAEPEDVEQIKHELGCKFDSLMVALKDNPSGLRRLLEILNNFTIETTCGDATEHSKASQV